MGSAMAADKPAPTAADNINRARTHFQAGQALYNLGNFNDAIREFSAGYQLAPRPQFLINLGQSYRKLGELEQARDMYRKFLVETDPKDPARTQVEPLLHDIEQQILTQPPKPKPQPKPVVVEPTANPLVVAVVPPRPQKSFARRHWWIFPVGAVVLAGAAVGIYFGVKPASQVGCGEASFGCLDVKMALTSPGP